MLWKGQKISRPKPVYVAIPRDGQDIVFICNAVLDRTEFEKVCPEPTPGVISYPGKQPVQDFESPEYKKQLEKHATRRWHWTILQSIKETPDISWETVDYNDPDTWANYNKELLDSGFLLFEVNAIIQGVVDANSMNEAKSKEALDRFTLSQAEAPVA